MPSVFTRLTILRRHHFQRIGLIIGIIQRAWLFWLKQECTSFSMVAADIVCLGYLRLVNTPNDSIDRSDPASSYNAIYLQHVFSTIDAFKSYTNVLGFFSGNEVINDVNTTGVST
jgi:Glucanosyltransferase